MTPNHALEAGFECSASGLLPYTTLLAGIEVVSIREIRPPTPGTPGTPPGNRVGGVAFSYPAKVTLKTRPLEAEVKLTPEEREVIVTYNDADRMWHVYSDSATMRSAMLRLAKRVGADVQQVGAGIEFSAPADALRLTAKRRLRLSPEQRDAQRVRARRHLSSERSAGATTRPLRKTLDHPGPGQE